MLRFFLPLFLTCLASTLHAGGGKRLQVEAITFESSGSNARISVPSKGESAPSVYYGGGGFATGQAARNLAEGQAAYQANVNRILAEDSRRRLEEAARILEARTAELEARAKAEAPTPPAPPAQNPRQFALQSSGKLSGGLYEILPNSGAFAAARHTLQGRSPDEVRAVLRKGGLNPDQYTVFEAWSAENKQLDFVLLLPREKIYDWLSPRVQSDCETTENIWRYELRELAQFQKTSAQGAHFYSRQFGITDPRGTEQISRGQISMTGIDHFYLPLGQENITTAGSSGSVVQLHQDKGEWKIGGFVECIVPARKTLNNVEIPGAVQVLSVSALGRALLIPTSLEAIGSEARVTDPECIPIDPRGAGG